MQAVPVKTSPRRRLAVCRWQLQPLRKWLSIPAGPNATGMAEPKFSGAIDRNPARAGQYTLDAATGVDFAALCNILAVHSDRP
jgi:hypothetical protein